MIDIKKNLKNKKIFNIINIFKEGSAQVKLLNIEKISFS